MIRKVLLEYLSTRTLLDKFMHAYYGLSLPRKLWVMGYKGFMGYVGDFPASQLGRWDFLWVMGGYGLREVWVIRVSTVYVVHDNVTVSYRRRVPQRRAWQDFCAHNRHLSHGDRGRPNLVPCFHILTGTSFLLKQVFALANSKDVQGCILTRSYYRADNMLTEAPKGL